MNEVRIKAQAVTAQQLTAPASMVTDNGLIHGMPGDWLVMFDDGTRWFVCDWIFNRLVESGAVTVADGATAEPEAVEVADGEPDESPKPEKPGRRGRA